MANKGLNGNGTWKTLALMAITAVLSLGGMVIHYGERIAKIENDIAWIKQSLSTSVAINTKGLEDET